jgi:hypothetical protein
LTFVPFCEELFMRFLQVPKLLLAAAVLAASAAAVHCCGGPMPVKTPGKIDRAVVHDNQLVAVTSTGHLVSVTMFSSKAKDLGTFDMKLAPCVDFAGGKACVASQNRLYQVDIATGKIVRAVICDQTIQSLGCISSNRAFVQNGGKVAIVDLAAGKTVQTMDLGKNVRCATFDPSAKRLYALTADEKCYRNQSCGLAILDLEKGKVQDRADISELRMPELRSPAFRAGASIYLAGERLYVVCPRFSYGIWIGSFGYIDLKSRKYHALKPPTNLQASFRTDHDRAHGQLFPGHAVLACPNGDLFLTGKDGVFRYQADGKLAGPVLGKGTGKLLGVWKRWAVVSTGECVEIERLPQVVARAK